MWPILLAGCAITATLQAEVPTRQLQLEIRFLVWKKLPQSNAPRIPERERIMAGADDLFPKPIMFVGKLPSDAETVSSLTTNLELDKPFRTTARIGQRLVEVSGTLIQTASGAHRLEFAPTQVQFTPYGPMMQRSHTTIDFGLNQWYVFGNISSTIMSANGRREEKTQATGFAARVTQHVQGDEADPTTDSTPYADPPFEE